MFGAGFVVNRAIIRAIGLMNILSLNWYLMKKAVSRPAVVWSDFGEVENAASK
jgi:hypothetical protein